MVAIAPKLKFNVRAPGKNSGVTPGTRVETTRVLLASHSHPQLSKGGAEIAAHVLFTELQAKSNYKTWFLGCVRDQMNQKLGATISQPFSDDEYLYASGAFDWFKFANRDANFPAAFGALLKSLAPQIVHFHHYINFGVEAFLHVRAILPNAKIVVTLHEYLAICHHYGQMITKQHRTLCYAATPLRCSNCFREITPSDFFLRKQYILRFFDLVDHFISPSNFLAERYVSWGIPVEKISIIENVIYHSVTKQAMGAPYKHVGPLRIGFFGQISVLKGIDVLMDAARFLEDRGEAGLIFEIFGDYSGQPPEYQALFLEKLANTGRNVIFHGPYDQNRVDQLMQSVDLVLTPSIWWENSPVVIQEALRNRRPIVCSDIGGMAEKVRNGIDGFHFPVGNSIALASLLLSLATSREELEKMQADMKPFAGPEHIVSLHDRLYARLLT